MAEIEEIQKYTSQKIYLDVYGGNADALPTAQFSDGTTLPVTQEAPIVSSGITDRYSVLLSMAHTQTQGNISITWTFNMSSVPVTKTDYFEVISPILSDGTIREIHPNATSDEVASIEKAVRHIIQAHCGQEFGHFIGSKTVVGRGGSKLRLPARLINLTSINGVVDPVRFSVSENGWELSYYPWGVNPYIISETYLTGGVIHDPTQVFWGLWDAGFAYDIVGEWGYVATPPAVAEAAKLLVNDYACGDNQYRDRFLTSMTAADWRIQFHDGAFTNTGNVRANQLLQEFVMTRDWVAI